jgi:hypothetical protein
MTNCTSGYSIGGFARSVLAAILALASGCGAAGSDSGESGEPSEPSPPASFDEPQSSEPNELGEILCSTLDLGVDEDTGFSMVEREVYSLPRINDRLEKHPEMAKGIGIDQVSDCAGAREFMKRYYEYTDAHPDFRLAGPTKAEQFERFLSDPENVAADGADGPEVEKISDGALANQPKTVQIMRQVSATKYEPCTASRLAGPLFITAAHCLKNPANHAEQSYQIFIRRQRANDNSFGFVGGSAGKPLHIYALGHPAYAGKGDWDSDVALIYVLKDHHALLQKEPDTYTANMLIATRSPADGDLQTFYGWGPTDNNPVNLGASRVRSTTQPWALFDVKAHYFYNVLGISNPITTMCRGDSGGPSIRSQMMDGIFVGFTPTFDETLNCPPGLNQTVYWSRVDEKLQWLQEAMNKLQTGPTKYRCVFTPGPGTGNAYEREFSYLSCNQ